MAEGGRLRGLEGLKRHFLILNSAVSARELVAKFPERHVQRA
jgi:hypothetical protein